MEGSSLPWNMIGFGVVLSIALILVGEYLQRRGSSFGISPMAVAVGIYLPFTTTFPILLGGIVHLLVSRKYQGSSKLDLAIQTGTVVCAGLVAGEALTGIFLAIPIGLDVLLPLQLIRSIPIRDILSVLVLFVLTHSIYRSIVKQTEK
jgi:uncharacterized oligopeptide transporter (OPT) family protein